MKPKNPTKVSWSIYSDILLDNTWHIFSSLLKCSVLFANDFVSYFTKTIEAIRKLLLSLPTISTNPPGSLLMYSALSPVTTDELSLLLSEKPSIWAIRPSAFPSRLLSYRSCPLLLHQIFHYYLILASFICCLYTVHIYLFACYHIPYTFITRHPKNKNHCPLTSPASSLVQNALPILAVFILLFSLKIPIKFLFLKAHCN